MGEFESLLDLERVLYGAIYFLALAFVAAWEGLAPRRTLRSSMRLRWANNFSFSILNTIIARMLFPVLGTGFAILVAERGWGVLNALAVPYPLAFGIGFLALDFGSWLQHYLLHRVPWLWRMHRMHHTDQDYDFTTGLRFHPIENLFTTSFGLLVIVAVGAPVMAVLVYQLTFLAAAMIIHGNVRLPTSIDGALRWILVTPDMHSIHHSSVMSEMNSNYGGILTWFDRAFSTYTRDPRSGYENMQIGIEEFQEEKHLTFGWMLINPFISPDETTVDVNRTS